MTSLSLHRTAEGAKTPCPLAFSTRNIDAYYLPPGSSMVIDVPSIVVNLSAESVALAPEVTQLRPWRSTIVRQVDLRAASPLVVLRMRELTNVGRLTLDEKWTALGRTEPADSPFPRDTPLFVSPTEIVGEVTVDRAHFSGEAATPTNPEPFQIHLKLWYAPPYTDCFIHTGHQFLEVHTQIHGAGRMQKFRRQDESTLFEDVPLLPGSTHECFAAVDGATWKYPWHRYYADTDCIWLAIELRPVPASSPADATAK